MVYDRNSRDGRDRAGDYGRDHGSGRDHAYSSERAYGAAGDYGRSGGRGRDRDDDDSRSFGDGFGARYGQRGDGSDDYGQRDRFQSQQGAGGYGRPYGSPSAGRGPSPYDRSDQPRYGQARHAQGDEYHGSYASDRQRFEDQGRGGRDDGRRGGARPGGAYGADRARQPQGYDHDDRGFFARAGDEVRSWFGDEDAERRREADMRYDEHEYGHRSAHDRDGDYGSWRSRQIAALDRDYDEYRTENRSRFENEFSSWRASRQGQRDLVSKVTEHMDVVGSDGSHVGTVDKTRGDRILLTKTDKDADGRHHSIPSSWLQSVDTKVTLVKSADEAKKHWRDEEDNQAMFADRPQADRGGDRSGGRDAQGRMLNRSFSGTY